MRIERLDLLAYGHYAEETLDLSRPVRGVTVVFGPNEAGKSTARRALIAALFGFEHDPPDAYRFTRHGLRVGVLLRAPDGSELSFERQGMSRAVDGGGRPVGADVVEAFSCGLRRDVYERLFSFGHDELRTGSESLIDAGGEIGQLVYGASLGSGSVNQVLARLDKRAAALFLERGRAQLIPKALDAYRGGMRKAKEARVRAREWDTLQRAVDDAAAHMKTVRAEFESARRDQERLQRIRSVRPLLTRRSQVLHERAALGDVPDETWASRASDATADYRTRRAAWNDAVAFQRDLARQVQAIDVPQLVLERAARIDALVKGMGRYEKDTDDLPKRRVELHAAADERDRLLRALGMAVDDGRIVAESNLVAVEVLLRRYAEVMAQGKTAREEFDKATELLSAVQARLAIHPVPPDVADLERALRLARPKLEVAAELGGRRIRLHAMDAELTARSGRLGLGELSRESVEALSVPSSVAIDAERDRRESVRLQLEQLEGERERIGTAEHGVEEELDRLGVDVPDPVRVAAARSHRDAGWSVVRRTLEGLPVATEWSNDLPLADAYEAAVLDADTAADDRYNHADELAKLAQLHARLGELAEERRTIGERSRVLMSEHETALSQWAQRWESAAVEARSPEEMASWLRDHQQLVADIAGWRQEGVACQSAAHDVERQVVAVGTALAAAGVEPCSEELDLLIAQADAFVDDAHASERARAATETELRLAEEALPRRSAAIERYEQDLRQFREAWAVAVRPLSLDPAADPESAAAAITAHRGLAEARQTLGGLEHRIDGIENDRRAFTAEVLGVAAGILELDPGAGPLDFVHELRHLVSVARSAADRRDLLVTQLHRATEAVEATTRTLGEARRALLALRAEVGMTSTDGEPDAGMDILVQQAREAAALDRKREDIDTDLLEQSGGLVITQLEAESGAASDALDGEIEALARTVTAHTERLEEATATLTDARRALEAVTDATTAADLEQDAQAELALAAELASEYCRTVLAADVLRRTIAEYGERHRGPLLNRAAELFRVLTDDAFTGLVPDSDGDRQVLLAKRRGGELCTAAMLSDGTRDQLYLALRLAGIEHQLGVVGAPPVVLDDILVHFDDGRAAAAMRVLGDLGQSAQVLLFTHHERTVEIAQSELDASAVSVVRLDRRDHDQPPIAVGTDGPGVGVPGWGRPSIASRDDAEERILAAARGSDIQPLSKAELLDLSGIPEALWSVAIRSLVARGVLSKEGDRKGARYRPVSS